MNVLVFNWRCTKHPFAGGAEISLMEHAKYWASQENEVTWFAASFKGAKKEEIVDGVKFIRQGNHFTVHLLAMLNYLKSSFRDIDIIVDCFHFIPFFTPLYIKNKKIIAFSHEIAGKLWFENLPYILAFIGYKLEPFFLRFYKNIPFIVVSESTRGELEKINISSSNIYVIHNGTKKANISNTLKEKFPTIIFLGRISKDKGIEDAIKAFKDIRFKMPANGEARQRRQDVRLWIVGKEEKSGYLQKLLACYNIDLESIKYFGFVKEDKKFELLKRAWILIHPSHKEGWGLTVIEAASQGTPTVGYNVEGLRDSILNNKTGLLTKKNPSSLADGVIKILKNKTLFSRLSEGSIKWSKKFDWKESVKKSYKLVIYVGHKA